MAKFRRHRQPWMHIVSTALMTGLLNLAVQPCVMAASLAEAPTRAKGTLTQGQGHQHSGHTADPGTGHAEQAHDQGHGDCSHCALFGRGDCAQDGGCSGPEVLQSNGAHQLKDDTTELVAPVPAPWRRWTRLENPSVTDIVARAKPPPPGPPLSVLYCVYRKLGLLDTPRFSAGINFEEIRYGPTQRLKHATRP